MNLTPEDLEKLRTKEVANAIRKLHAGKTLTAAERALLAGAAEVDASGGGYAGTWEALATALGVDRKTLEHFRQRHASRIKAAGAELTRADGRHVVAAWRTLADEFGELRGKGINNPALTADDYIDERQLRLRRERVQLFKAEFELEKAKESMLPVAEFQAALSAMVNAFVTTLNQVPGRAAQKLTARVKIAALDMLRGALTEAQFAKVEPLLDSAAIDYAEIQQLLDAEIEHARTTLAQCEFLNDSPAASVSETSAESSDHSPNPTAKVSSSKPSKAAASKANPRPRGHKRAPSAKADIAAAQCPSPQSAPGSSAPSSKPPSRRRRVKSSGDSSSA